MISQGTMAFFMQDHYSAFSLELWTVQCDGTLRRTLILAHLRDSISIINVPSLQTPTNHLAKLQWANQWCEAVEFSHHRRDSRWAACNKGHNHCSKSYLHLHNNLYHWYVLVGIHKNELLCGISLPATLFPAWVDDLCPAWGEPPLLPIEAANEAGKMSLLGVTDDISSAT